ncbi:hypothetical protein Zmor_009137 [Zophobas morio]|uniref:Uncharacterized protein n=1 Tax=Zophobas morio TaxID=2755281 RepID=A0AA38INM3_9CUCU|nr:hypothetical protein Zmor_009137 [Zophobas morio]
MYECGSSDAHDRQTYGNAPSPFSHWRQTFVKTSRHNTPRSKVKIEKQPLRNRRSSKNPRLTCKLRDKISTKEKKGRKSSQLDVSAALGPSVCPQIASIHGALPLLDG